MSFCTDCKQEIIDSIQLNECCLASHLYGMLMFFSHIFKDEFSVSIENTAVLEHMLCCFRSYGIQLGDECIEYGKKISTFRITDKDICNEIYEQFGFANTAPSYMIDEGFFMCDACSKAFVAGAFLMAGSVTEPTKGYHLEFATHRTKIASGLVRILERMGFEPKLTVRSYESVVYFKSSEQIEDLLTTLCAVSSSMELMEAKIYKDLRNQVTRRVNCESGNMEKTIRASAEDVLLFSRFLESGGEEILNDELLCITRLRIERPECSLSELAELCEGITKSGINHRLRKIRETAREYLENRNQN